MSKTKIEQKWDDLTESAGINPPGKGHDLELTYHETVRNLAQQGRGKDLPEDAYDDAVAYFAKIEADATEQPVSIEAPVGSGGGEGHI